MGKHVKETAEELGISTRQVSRDKNSALEKMLKRMKAAGYESYAGRRCISAGKRLYSNTDGNTEFNYEKKNWGSEIAIG